MIAKRHSDSLGEYEMIPDKEWVSNPDNWPNWPWLPLVSKTGNAITRSIGLIHAGDMTEVILNVNLWDITKEKIKNAEVKKYDSVEQLLNEWRVD